MEYVLWGYRQLFCCRRRVSRFLYGDADHKKETVSQVDIPWLWLGIQHDNFSPVSFTNLVNDRIRYGDHVTEDYLAKLTGYYIGRWKYIDMKTLEEKDFPSEGFIIEKK